MASKPWIATSASLLAASLLLAACGGNGQNDQNSQSANSSQSQAPSGKSDDGKAVRLTFWNGFTGPDRPGYENLVKQFNDTHPNIQVTMDVSPWDTLLAKLPTSLATGQGPDIAAFDSSLITKYAKSQLILPLDDLYGNGIDPGIFPQPLANVMKYEGKFFGVPANNATLLLYYNKDLFKAAGLDPEKPPATWDEWIDAIEKTTKSDGSDKQYGIALADHATIAMWPILVWGNGGDFVSTDGKTATMTDPKTVEAIKRWSDLVVGKGASPTNLTGAEADKLFQSGKAAMEMNGPWATAGYTDAGLNYDVAPIPAGPAGEVTLASSAVLVAGKNTKHIDAVREFMQYWVSKDAQAQLSGETGFPPVRTDLGDDERLKQNPFVPKFAAESNNAKYYLPGLEQYDKIDADVIIPAIQAITNQKSSAEDALAQANKQLQDILDGND
ncbi:ABC transporter substrate-binding protein [Cohnella zeiphila]|uniref:ABC transporter substrate-binding protein n=1 Tax=Cohnella zeiphila TaxID=2761120 RepID=A0A7X0SK78_9BACL|nr:ABC transporter substrate-binding protein [Cohnella zeiphila]MBB6731461.1 ABC transporter substrate-binding protein [Cohnella zeiphila]